MNHSTIALAQVLDLLSCSAGFWTVSLPLFTHFTLNYASLYKGSNLTVPF